MYGYKEETLAEIGEGFNLRESAARKAKDKALDKLCTICMEGDLGYWMSVRNVIRKAALEAEYGSADGVKVEKA